MRYKIQRIYEDNKKIDKVLKEFFSIMNIPFKSIYDVKRDYFMMCSDKKFRLYFIKNKNKKKLLAEGLIYTNESKSGK